MDIDQALQCVGFISFMIRIYHCENDHIRNKINEEEIKWV